MLAAASGRQQLLAAPLAAPVLTHFHRLIQPAALSSCCGLRLARLARVVSAAPRGSGNCWPRAPAARVHCALCQALPDVAATTKVWGCLGTIRKGARPPGPLPT